MNNEMKQKLILGGIGILGVGAVVGGFMMTRDGVEELEETYYDIKSGKDEMLESAGNALMKSAGGILMTTVGGMLVGGSIGTAYNVGKESNDILKAPVLIAAKSLEDATRDLEALKAVQNITDQMPNAIYF